MVALGLESEIGLGPLQHNRSLLDQDKGSVDFFTLYYLHILPLLYIMENVLLS